jgi:hypothetical protein
MPSLVETPEYQAAARFVDLTLEKRALLDRLDEITAQLKTLEPALVGYLTAAKQPRFAVRDYLLSTAREPWIYPITGVSREMVCEALKISGLAKMVKENYSTQSLTAHIKGLEAHHKLTAGLQPDALEKILPPALAHILQVKPAYKIRVERKQRPAYDYQPEPNEDYPQEMNDEQP